MKQIIKIAKRVLKPGYLSSKSTRLKKMFFVLLTMVLLVSVFILIGIRPENNETERAPTNLDSSGIDLTNSPDTSIKTDSSEPQPSLSPNTTQSNVMFVNENE